MTSIRWYMDDKEMKGAYFVSEVMTLSDDQFVKTDTGVIDHTLIMSNKTIDGEIDNVSSVVVDVNSVIRVVSSTEDIDTQTLYRICGAKTNDPDDTVSLFLSKIREDAYNPKARLFIGGKEVDGVSFHMPPVEIVGRINETDGDSFYWIASASITVENDGDLDQFFDDLYYNDSHIRYADPLCMYDVFEYNYKILNTQDYVYHNNLKAEIIFFMG